VLNRVDAAEKQQYSATVGGRFSRIAALFGKLRVRARAAHDVLEPAWPAFNVALSGTKSVKLGSVRLDYDCRRTAAVMLKGNMTKSWQPFDDLAQPSRRHRHDRFVHRPLAGQ